jgi:hypothetical protein
MLTLGAQRTMSAAGLTRNLDDPRTLRPSAKPAKQTMPI